MEKIGKHDRNITKYIIFSTFRILKNIDGTNEWAA